MHIHQALHVCQGDWIFIKVHKNAKRIRPISMISSMLVLKCYQKMSVVLQNIIFEFLVEFINNFYYYSIEIYSK